MAAPANSGQTIRDSNRLRSSLEYLANSQSSHNSPNRVVHTTFVVQATVAGGVPPLREVHRRPW